MAKKSSIPNITNNINAILLNRSSTNEIINSMVNNHSSHDINDTEEIEKVAAAFLVMSENEESTIRVMSRNTILSIFFVIASQIYIILSIYTFFTEYSNLYISYTWAIYWAFNCLLSSLVIFLSFDFAIDWYYICCGMIDPSCISCCIFIASTRERR